MDDVDLPGTQRASPRIGGREELSELNQVADGQSTQGAMAASGLLQQSNAQFLSRNPGTHETGMDTNGLSGASSGAARHEGTATPLSYVDQAGTYAGMRQTSANESVFHAGARHGAQSRTPTRPASLRSGLVLALALTLPLGALIVLDTPSAGGGAASCRTRDNGTQSACENTRAARAD